MSNMELWYFLAPVEEGQEMAFDHLEEAGLLRRRPSLESEKPPPRPMSALKDSTGRSMVYGNPNFRFAQMDELDKMRGKRHNDYEGSLRGGLPHGLGKKIYLNYQQWKGRLWPFGTILTKTIEGNVIRYSDYLKEVGLLRKLNNPILLVDGNHVVKDMLDISRIMERIKHVHNHVFALIVNISSEQTFQEVGYHAKHSPYLESFPGPVIGVMKGEFDFEPLGWPSTTEIRSRVGDLKEEFERPSFEDNWWQMQASISSPPVLRIRPEGEHHLDKHGVFPLVPVGQFEVRLEWEGIEVYVGNFKDGAKHGKGIFIRSNGDKHVGIYAGGIAHGKGAYHWKNGDIFVGSWLHGRQEKKGEMRTRGMQHAALVIQCNFRISQARQEVEAIRSKQRRRAQEALELEQAQDSD